MTQTSGEAQPAKQESPALAWVHPTRCLSPPQCEQFVEQHSLQLQSFVSRGWDAHTACQVCPLLPAGLRTSSHGPHP